MKGKIKYTFEGTTWQSTPLAGWNFVSLPLDLSKEIRTHLQWQEEGWGRLKVVASINNSEWGTAIWFDTKRNTYLLPLKAEVRKKQNIHLNQSLVVTLWI